jgi:hypothetical protein
MRVLEFRFDRVTALAALLAAVATAGAQDIAAVADRPPTLRIGRILGVFDASGAPLEGAEVVDRIGGGQLRTTRSGLVGMGVVTSQHDSAVVTIRKIGFADTTLLVMVGSRDTVPVQVFLRHATMLEQVTVTARESEHLPFYLKDFEERLNDAKWSGARTFTPAELRKRDGERLYDVLFGKHAAVKTPRCGRIIVYRDGVPWEPPEIESGSAGVPKDDVDRYDAAVFYTLAQMPSEIFRTVAPFDGDGARKAPAICGALMLYSRHKI